MVVGRQYQVQGSLLAAQNRFETVIRFPTTAFRGLYRLIETSLALGLKAVQATGDLSRNYPANIWYHRGNNLLTD